MKIDMATRFKEGRPTFDDVKALLKDSRGHRHRGKWLRLKVQALTDRAVAIQVEHERTMAAERTRFRKVMKTLKRKRVYLLKAAERGKR